MKNKAHLTKEGFEQIKQIKSGMNTGRKELSWESSISRYGCYLLFLFFEPSGSALFLDNYL